MPQIILAPQSYQAEFTRGLRELGYVDDLNERAV
jgi:hypothetical protein